MKATETENLLDFLNTASSSVKNVLARPSCFKRNTNHRRFLQKQLKVSKQREGSASANRRVATHQQFTLSKGRQRTTSRKKTQAINSEVLATKMQTQCVKQKSFSDNNQSIVYMGLEDSQDLQKQMNYLAECKKFSEMVDDLVDNLLDSSSNCSHDETEQRRITEMQSNTFQRSGSISSYSSSSDEEIHAEFLSGEDLLRCLDISELFVPEGIAGPHRERSEEETNNQRNELQIVPGDESPVHEQLMYETDMIDAQNIHVFENVFQQFVL